MKGVSTQRRAERIAPSRPMSRTKMLSLAAEWGSSVPFWVRHGNASEASRKAKKAAHYALMALGHPRTEVPMGPG